jgi:hypothetical protein
MQEILRIVKVIIGSAFLGAVFAVAIILLGFLTDQKYNNVNFVKQSAFVFCLLGRVDEFDQA